MSTNKKYCSICGCEINGFGNNPYPINNGRCCDACNDKVIEMRIVMNQMSSCIDNLVNSITPNENMGLCAFTYYDKHYGFAIYKNGAKKLTVEVQSDDEDGWGVYTNNEILRMCIQNYLDYNHKDKKLGKIRRTDGFTAKAQLSWHLAGYIMEKNEKVA